MSTLAEQFLNDFNDFNDDIVNKNTSTTSPTTTTTTTINVNNVNINKDNDQDTPMDIDNQDLGDLDDLMLSDEQIEAKQLDLINKFKDSSVEVIAKLLDSNRLQQLIEKVEKQMKQSLPVKTGGARSQQDYIEHALIVECNTMIQEIQHEIYLIHKYVLEKYQKKFPELSQSISNALDYINVVKRIGNATDLKNIELSDLLPRSTVMVLMVTLSSTTGKPLSDTDLLMVEKACEMALTLDSHKKLILTYLESRMTFIAPNLTVLIGGTIAAKLIGIAGSIQKLSIIPAGNLQNLGADTKRSLGGFSSLSYKKYQNGLVSQCEIIKNIPADLKVKTLRALIGRISLAARIDAGRSTSLNGEMGQQYKDEILGKVQKLQEPPPSKKEKPLPLPIDKQKKKRGGEKARRRKALFQATDLRKAQNRMSFNVEEQTLGDMDMGMIGGETGKVRLTAQDKGILKKKKLEQKTFGGSQTHVSGLQSVAMTPTQGLQLSVTTLDSDFNKSHNKTEKYFGKDRNGTKRKLDDF